MKESNSKEELLLIPGDLAVDDRGEVGFVNNFDMRQVKRFYTVVNHKTGFIRAWHAHKRERKYVTVVSGTAIIAVVKIDNWDKPSKDLTVHRYILSSRKPSVLSIPNEYANGFMNLVKDTVLIFFSTATLQESLNDDIRYEAHYWNPWNIVER